MKHALMALAFALIAGGALGAAIGEAMLAFPRHHLAPLFGIALALTMFAGGVIVAWRFYAPGPS